MSSLPSIPAAGAASGSQKRKAEDDEKFGLSPKLTTTSKLYQKFIDAYKGNNSEALGSDCPRKNKSTLDAVNPQNCVLILSTADESTVLFNSEEDGAIKAKYDVSTQNPMLEIKLGLPQTHPFKSSHSLINSEQICGEVKRTSITNPTADLFRQVVIDLGLPSINANNESIKAAIDCIPKQDKEDNQNNAISFMRLRIRGPLPAPRAAQGYNGGYSSLAAKLVGA